MLYEGVLIENRLLLVGVMMEIEHSKQAVKDIYLSSTSTMKMLAAVFHTSDDKHQKMRPETVAFPTLSG